MNTKIKMKLIVSRDMNQAIRTALSVMMVRKASDSAIDDIVQRVAVIMTVEFKEYKRRKLIALPKDLPPVQLRNRIKDLGLGFQYPISDAVYTAVSEYNKQFIPS